MDFRLQGRVAMVAAASKGIGFATAKMLAEEGCAVSICARTEDALHEAAAKIGGDTRSYVVDVKDPADLEWWVQQTNEDLGTPTILVTNTGGPPAGMLSQINDDQWQEGFDSTLMNVVRLVRAVQPGMKEEGWGRIVHVSSLVAVEPYAMLPISSTLRAGLNSLTRLQAQELASHGITVNTVLPGHTLTDRQRHLADIKAKQAGITQEQALENQAMEVPLRRLADPEEIAAAITFLCSEQAGYITGTHVLVDGGLVKSG